VDESKKSMDWSAGKRKIRTQRPKRMHRQTPEKRREVNQAWKKKRSEGLGKMKIAKRHCRE